MTQALLERGWRVVGTSRTRCFWGFVPVVLELRTEDTVAEPETVQRKARSLQVAIKEVVGFRVLLAYSLFGDGIPRRLLLRVSLEKPISVPLRF